VRQTKKPKPAVEVVILAGGASSRMGRDKARVRIAGWTLLRHVRAAAQATGWPVRVVRHDAVRKCGPLGGVLTALLQRGTRNAERGTSGVLVFLSCDMPFVSAAMIRRIADAISGRRPVAFFEDADDRVGFPFALRRSALTLVEQQVAQDLFSLQAFARVARARRLRIPSRAAWRWFNVNTPADLAQARRMALLHRSRRR
jgi:molybdenum cofactor guanylyltransferase